MMHRLTPTQLTEEMKNVFLEGKCDSNGPLERTRFPLSVQVIQTRKSFPFGTCVNSQGYQDPTKQKYRDFIHQHFNWAVPEVDLKWRRLEPTEVSLVSAAGDDDDYDHYYHCHCRHNKSNRL